MSIAMEALANAMSAKETAEICQKHGCHLMEARNPRFGTLCTYCPQCDLEKLQALQLDFDRRAQAEIQARKFRENSLVNPKMWDCTFDTFNAEDGSREAVMKKKVGKAAEAFAAKKVAHHAVLYGQPGAGKSHLAMALMQEVHQTSGQTMAFINISRLFSHLKNSFDDPSEYWTKEKALQVMTGVDLLCIDDLGTESSMGRSGQEATKWAQDVIYDVLENQDRIIITTNLSEQEMKRVYDAKIFSRIFANSQNTRFDFTGIADKRLMLMTKLAATLPQFRGGINNDD